MPMPCRVKTGDKYGRLMVLREIGFIDSRRRFLCRCDCGKDIHADGAKLRSGHTKSCGCYKRDVLNAVLTKHGMARASKNRTSEYRIWAHIKTRCFNNASPAWRRYGGRGITMDAVWASDFSAFLRDVGLRPSKAYSIDRIDNDKGYFKENVRWATQRQQCRNTCRTLMVVLDGVTMPFMEACERRGFSDDCVRQFGYARQITAQEAFDAYSHFKSFGPARPRCPASAPASPTPDLPAPGYSPGHRSPR